ncbi:YkuS family protein [Fodinisporobacter ferrooxydans]|uniref:YkuS family protein n=1 Tax=Fodinisporobacter ferrooxydans TaxID=2901836 RepID=A0ABY4CJB7_9BACL|nr:YkuS family protein [Alicyclobacillaceae bacterium MYW30-H2]
MKKVCVESNLSPMQEYLSNQGCQVETLDANSIQNASANSTSYSAIVISGADQNLMGMQSVQCGCPVINASGLTPEQVYNRIQSEGK